MKIQNLIKLATCDGDIKTGNIGSVTDSVVPKSLINQNKELKNGISNNRDKFRNEEQQLCKPRHVALPYPPLDMEWVI